MFDHKFNVFFLSLNSSNQLNAKIAKKHIFLSQRTWIYREMIAESKVTFQIKVLAVLIGLFKNYIPSNQLHAFEETMLPLKFVSNFHKETRHWRKGNKLAFIGNLHLWVNN